MVLIEAFIVFEFSKELAGFALAILKIAPGRRVEFFDKLLKADAVFP